MRRGRDLYSIMEGENNYSDKLGSDILDWQLGNWANDVTMALHNALDNQERADFFIVWKMTRKR